MNLVLRWSLFAVLGILVRLAEAVYQGEGIATLMLVLPTQLVTPILHKYGARIGTHVRFRTPLILHNSSEDQVRSYFKNLQVGNGAYFGKLVFLDLKDRIVIEDNVTVSMRVTILTHTDVGNSPLSHSILPPAQAPVIIRQGAYIGAGAIILSGVEIGAMAIVGAGAVVTKNVPPRCVVAGSPAQPIRNIESVE
ncbi:serine O-acetyltransferase [Anaerolineae bacterium]|nr:serine O-acetyltransferase [Anaerolineae bacterium]